VGKIKVTYIISDIDKALAFEWIAAYINKEKITLSFILLNPATSILQQFLNQNGFEVHLIRCRGKKDWLPAIARTYKILKKINPAVVHCHLLQANIIGLIAAKMAGVKKRIYTRHHSSLHHVYFKKGIWWDKLANSFATTIIAISGTVKKILLDWEKVPAKKVVLIPHGFVLKDFEEVSADRAIRFKQHYSVGNAYPVVGVISRFTEWKGVQYIVPAFIELCKHHPESILLLLNAQGDYEEEIMLQLKALPENNYRLIPFEKDIAAAYKTMDMFIHVPIDDHSEAFGQIYVEALAAGVPAIFTRSGIANDEMFNDSNVVFVEHKNENQILEAMLATLDEKGKTAKRIEAGKNLSKQFGLAIYINKLEKLYLGL
jgi:glycosyltransferase involved in cell wall biosynthesis